MTKFYCVRNKKTYKTVCTAKEKQNRTPKEWLEKINRSVYIKYPMKLFMKEIIGETIKHKCLNGS